MNQENPIEPLGTNEQQPISDNSFKSRFLNTTKIGWGLVILVFVLIAAGVGAYYTGYLDKIFKDPNFNVVSASPQGENAELDTDIYIKFNHPVAAHDMGEHIEIIPNLNGTFEHGSDPEDVVFRPEAPFAPSMLITVRLKAGLPSENGKMLKEDYYFSFTTKALDNGITFSKDGRSAKFMSFHADRGVDLDVTIGPEVTQPNAKLYKVESVDDMLNNFSYKPSEYPSVYNNYGEYIETSIDTTKYEPIQEINNIAELKRLSFKQKPGLYILEARDGDKVLNTAWVSLTNIGVHFRQDDQNVILAAQNLNSGAPEENVEYTIYEMESKPKVVQKNVLPAIGTLPYVFPKTVDMIVARKGEDVMVIPVNVPNSQANFQVYDNLNTKLKIFLYTERPIYQPGDKLFYRGVARIDNDAIYKVPPAGTKIRVSMYNSDGSWTDQIVTLRADGTYSGEFNLPTEVSQQYFNLSASKELSGDERSGDGYASFEIIKYTKPDFGIEVKTERAEYLRGDTVKAAIQGRYFNGNTMANEKVSYSVYYRDYFETEKAVYNESFNLNGWGGMCGIGFNDGYYGEQIGQTKDITLDSNGNATVQFNSSDLPQPYSKEVVIVAQKKDKSNNDINSASTSVVHAGDFNIFFRPSKNAQVPNGPFSYVFYAETYDGKKLPNKTFKYSLAEITYNNNKEEKKTIFDGDVTTNGDGVGIVTGKYPESTQNSHEFIISTKDSRGNIVEANTSIYLSENSIPNSWANTVLNIQSSKNNFKPGESISLEIDSPAAMKVLASFERGRVYKPNWVDIKKGKNTVNFPVENEYVPSITPTFSFFYNGAFHIEGLSLNVPALDKVLNIEVQTNKSQYVVGETAIVTIKTRDASGNPVPAKVGIGVVDKAIFALRKNATQPIHSSFYFFRSRTTNSSSSLTWVTVGCECGGGMGGGGGESGGGKDVDTLAWNPDIQTGADGTAIVSVPVGNQETTWKILTYGSTNDTDLGQGENEFLVTK